MFSVVQYDFIRGPVSEIKDNPYDERGEGYYICTSHNHILNVQSIFYPEKCPNTGLQKHYDTDIPHEFCSQDLDDLRYKPEHRQTCCKETDTMPKNPIHM